MFSKTNCVKFLIFLWFFHFYTFHQKVISGLPQNWSQNQCHSDKKLIFKLLFEKSKFMEYYADQLSFHSFCKFWNILFKNLTNMATLREKCFSIIQDIIVLYKGPEKLLIPQKLPFIFFIIIFKISKERSKLIIRIQVNDICVRFWKTQVNVLNHGVKCLFKYLLALEYNSCLLYFPPLLIW